MFKTQNEAEVFGAVFPTSGEFGILFKKTSWVHASEYDGSSPVVFWEVLGASCVKNGFMEIELSFSDNSIMSVYFAIK